MLKTHLTGLGRSQLQRRTSLLHVMPYSAVIILIFSHRALYSSSATEHSFSAVSMFTANRYSELSVNHLQLPGTHWQPPGTIYSCRHLFTAISHLFTAIRYSFTVEWTGSAEAGEGLAFARLIKAISFVQTAVQQWSASCYFTEDFNFTSTKCFGCW